LPSEKRFLWAADVLHWLIWRFGMHADLEIASRTQDVRLITRDEPSMFHDWL